MNNLPKAAFENHYIPTLNQMGFMLTKIDPLVSKFIDYAIANQKKWHLDVGAAYGIATIECLNGGAKVIANDLDENHLNAIKSLAPQSRIHNLKTCIGDIRNDLDFTKDSIASVLFSRVLHFLKGPEIIDCLKKVHYWLEPMGKIFVVNETPYFGTLKAFIPVYENRVSKQILYPGYMDTHEAASFFEVSKRPFVNSPVHLFDKNLCHHVCKESEFKIEEIGYLNRKEFFPEEALFDGRESIWFIATKKG